MDSYIALCIVLCVVSGSSPASLRLPRQIWPDPVMEQDHGHFLFPDQPVPGRADSSEFSNEVLAFPDTMTRPGGMENFGFRPRPTSSSSRRPSGGSGQIPDFSSNPWLNGINGQRPSGGNGQIPDFSNNPWLNGQRPTSRPNNQGSSNNQQQTTSTTTPSTTTRRASTPRTFHIAPEGCDCPSTPQFNPVCGSDGNTYKNSGLLNCFRLCGVDVSQRRMGSC